MSKQALTTSQAVADLLRSRRQELGLSLRQVQRRAAAAGRPIPFTTLSKIEHGRVDPGVRRLHQLLEIYRLPLRAIEDLLDLEAMADDLPATDEPERLYREGLDHWRAGDLRKGLAHFFALRRAAPDDPEDRAVRQKGLVSFAVAAGSLGKHQLSLLIVQQLLVEPMDRVLLLSTLIQAGASWNALGSTEAALAFLNRADSHLEQADHLQRAWVGHEKAISFLRERSFDCAARALDQAVRSYRKAGDHYGEGRSIGARVKLRRMAGDFRAAIRAARTGQVHAERHGFKRLWILRRLDEGQDLVSAGDAAAGLQALNEAVAAAISNGDQAAQFYAHYNLWKAYEKLEEPDRADLELESARFYVRFVDEASEEAEEIRR